MLLVIYVFLNGKYRNQYRYRYWPCIYSVSDRYQNVQYGTPLLYTNKKKELSLDDHVSCNGGGRPSINSLLNIFSRVPARIDPDKIKVTQGSQQNKPPITILKSPEVVRGKLFIKGTFIPQCPWKHMFNHITNTNRKKNENKKNTVWHFGSIHVGIPPCSKCVTLFHVSNTQIHVHNHS